MKWLSLTLSLAALAITLFPYIPTPAKNAESELKTTQELQVCLWRKLDSRIVEFKGARLEEAIKAIRVEEIIPGKFGMPHEKISMYFTVPCVYPSGEHYLGTIQAFLMDDGYWSVPGLRGKVKFGCEFTRLVMKAVSK